MQPETDGKGRIQLRKHKHQLWRALWLGGSMVLMGASLVFGQTEPAVAPGSQSVLGGGGTLTASVTVSGSVAWSASSNAAWIAMNVA